MLQITDSEKQPNAENKSCKLGKAKYLVIIALVGSYMSFMLLYLLRQLDMLMFSSIGCIGF